MRRSLRRNVDTNGDFRIYRSKHLRLPRKRGACADVNPNRKEKYGPRTHQTTLAG